MPRTAALACLVVLMSACGSPPPPDLVLITMDTTRRDHTSVYGYERDTTPNLAAFAAQGARFDAAYAPTATTGPTHASLFTSLYPLTHGVVKNGRVLDETFVTLAEALAANGYQTAAAVSSFPLNAKFGYHQGFASYDDDFGNRKVKGRGRRWRNEYVEGRFDRRANETTDKAIELLDGLRNDPKRPFFLFLHYFDPHKPYEPPRRFEPTFDAPIRVEDSLERSRNQYDREIAFMDREIGRLLAALDLGERDRGTLILITADHGEGLMDHGIMQHGEHIYEESVRVPLLIRWPGTIAAGTVIPEPVSLIDLAPTILDLTGTTWGDPEPRRGTSLAAALHGNGRLAPDRPIYLYRRHYGYGHGVRGEKFAVRSGRWKYIVGDEEGTLELFDLAADAAERENLYDANRDVAAELVAGWRESQMSSTAPPGEIAEEDREGLEALGYAE